MQVKGGQQRPDRTKKALSGLGKMRVAGTFALFEWHSAQKCVCGCWRNWKLASEIGCCLELGCEGQQTWGEKQSVEQRSASMSHCHCPGPGHWLSLGHGTDLLTDLLPASTLGF